MISALIFRSTGRLAANELMMTGRLLSASEALDAGLLNRVVADEDFDDAVQDWVATIASKSPPLLLGLGKNAIAATRDLPPWMRHWTTCRPSSPWPSPPRTLLKESRHSRRSERRSGATRDDTDLALLV